jgi:hypothetical protein
MDKDYLLLERAALSRPSGEWNDDDFDVLANAEIVGRIYKANAAPVGSPLDVDTRLLAPRRSQPNARVCCDPRSRHGSLCQELAARVTHRQHVTQNVGRVPGSANGSGNTRRANPLIGTPGRRSLSIFFIATKCVPAVSTSSKMPIQRGGGSARLVSIS